MSEPDVIRSADYMRRYLAEVQAEIDRERAEQDQANGDGE